MRLRLHFSLAALPLLLAASFALLRQPVLAGTPEAGPADVHNVYPSQSIQAAIDAASAGDTVRVAAGVYYERLTMKEGVSLHGQGWAKTIIHGGSVSATSVIYLGPGITPATVISGVQVTRGVGHQGACIRIENASPVIRDTWVFECLAAYGGGVAVLGGSPTFDNVPAWNNLAAVAGGAFYLGPGSRVTITGGPLAGTNGTLLSNVSASHGGAIHAEDASASLSGLSIGLNMATSAGGGVSISGTLATVTLTHSLVVSNSTNGWGGGFAAFNQAGAVIDSSGLFSNTASAGGAVIAINAGDVTLTNNIIARNVTTEEGGGAGGIGAINSTLRLINNTIADNDGTGVVLCQAPSTRIINNIIARNYYLTTNGAVGGGIADSAGCGGSPSLALGYNDVWANLGDGNYSNLTPGAGDVSVNPQFLGGADLTAYYHLRATSPVRAAGSTGWAPPFDIDGQPRSLFGTVSIGADEVVYQSHLPLARRQ